MKLDTKTLVISLALLVVLGIGLYFKLSCTEKDVGGGDEILRSRRIGDADSKTLRKKSRTEFKQSRMAAHRLKEGRAKLQLQALEDEEERELTDLAKKVLASLQAALDADDIMQVRAVLATVRNAPKGSLSQFAEGMPVALKKRLIEALGWFGGGGLAEMLEFLADDNADVRQMAADQFVQALQDIELGDRERSEIVSMASKVLTDDDTLDMMFMEISNMRNSVAAQTLINICYEGTEAAKAKMPETIEFVTGEENITTVEDLQKWLDENPDGPDDEDLYGPMKLDD